MVEINENLLLKIEEALISKQVPHKNRSFSAFSMLSKEYGLTISFSSPEAKLIDEWFSQRVKSSATKIGSLYESCFYYDCEFWKISIPIHYGTIDLSPIDGLIDMPTNIKTRLLSDPDMAISYYMHWANVYDISSFISNRALDKNSKNYSNELFLAANEELMSATSAILGHRVNTRAAMQLRMATEMFLKSYLILKHNADLKTARKYNHNILELYNRLCVLESISPDKEIIKVIMEFPDISDRYENSTHISETSIFQMYELSISLAALRVREETDLDTRKQIIGALNQHPAHPTHT
ncbi:hypothetical protein ACSZNU_21410 [Aeromonas hydrophila]